MPFSSKFDDIYEFGIKAACVDAGAYAERVDEQIFHSSILDRIYNQISKANLIVADMTDQNPNVFYECGYAHALGKRVILLTQKLDDIPFDLKHYPHIVYSGRISDLKQDLTKHVRWSIENPEGIQPIQTDIELYINGKHIDKSSCPTISIGESFKCNFYNPAVKNFHTAQFKFALVIQNLVLLDLFEEVTVATATEFKEEWINEKKELVWLFKEIPQFLSPRDGYIYISDKLFKLLPGAWASIVVKLGLRNRDPRDSSHTFHTLPLSYVPHKLSRSVMVIRLLTEFSPINFLFTIE